MDATNALVEEAQVALKNIVGLDAFVNKEQWSVIQIKRRISCQVCSKFVIHLSTRKVTYFSYRITTIILNLANKRKIIN